MARITLTPLVVKMTDAVPSMQHFALIFRIIKYKNKYSNMPRCILIQTGTAIEVDRKSIFNRFCIIGHFLQKNAPRKQSLALEDHRRL